MIRAVHLATVTICFSLNDGMASSLPFLDVLILPYTTFLISTSRRPRVTAWLSSVLTYRSAARTR